MSTRFLRPSLCLALVLQTAAVRAQPRSEVGAAEALFVEGRIALEAGDFERACLKLDESLRLEAAAGTLFNLAICTEKLGKPSAAWAHLRGALAALPVGDPRRAHAEAEVRRLEAIVAHLTIVAPDSAAGATITRDGAAIGRGALGSSLPVDPGRHVVSVAMDGRGPRELVVMLAPGERRTVVAEPGPAVPPAAVVSVAEGAPATRPSAPPPARRVAAPVAGPLALGAAGAGALVVGLVAGGMALARKGELKAHCSSNGECDPRGTTVAGEVNALAKLATVSVGAGLLAVAGGVAWCVGTRCGRVDVVLAGEAGVRVGAVFLGGGWPRGTGASAMPAPQKGSEGASGHEGVPRIHARGAEPAAHRARRKTPCRAPRARRRPERLPLDRYEMPCPAPAGTPSGATNGAPQRENGAIFTPQAPSTSESVPSWIEASTQDDESVWAHLIDRSEGWHGRCSVCLVITSRSDCTCPSGKREP